jgi:hypothetical protein
MKPLLIRGYEVLIRRGTHAQWFQANPLLKRREPAIETDTKKVKIGDGVTLYKHLPYIENLQEFLGLNE